MRQKKKWLFVLIPLAGLAALVLTDWLVESERERLDKIIKQLERAAEVSDWRECMRHVSTSYDHDGLNYQTLNLVAEGLAGRVGTMDIWMLHKRVTIKSTVATLDCEIVSMPGGERPRLPGTGRSTWQLTFRNENGEWRITRANPTSAGGRPVSTLKELLEMPF